MQILSKLSITARDRVRWSLISGGTDPIQAEAIAAGLWPDHCNPIVCISFSYIGGSVWHIDCLDDQFKLF